MNVETWKVERPIEKLDSGTKLHMQDTNHLSVNADGCIFVTHRTSMVLLSDTCYNAELLEVKPFINTSS
jgi:hypothetical protein